MSTAAMAEPAGMSHAWRGRVGMIGLIIAEGSLFSVFVVAYLFYIGKSLNGPYPREVLELPVLGTICLLSSSVFVALGSRALSRGDVRGCGLPPRTENHADSAVGDPLSFTQKLIVRSND